MIVHADSNLLGRVTTRVRSGSLVIGNTPGNLNAKSPMFVAVSVPSLAALTLRGHGNIAVTGINAQSLIVALPGSGTIQASGRAAWLEVTVSGSGTGLLSQLTADDVNATLSGHGSIMLTATRSLSGSVSGSGTILYHGNPPHISTTVTGTGAITPL